MRLNAERLLALVEPALYSPRGRRISLLLLAATTLILLLQAIRLQPDAGFEKTLPLDHPYMQVFRQYQAELGGANAVLVALLQKDGDIYNAEFLESLRSATNEVDHAPGIDRTRLSSLFTRNVRYLEVVDGGFRAEDVVPADYAPSPQMFDTIRLHVIKSGLIGRLVSQDQRGAMVVAEVLDREPMSGARTDAVRLAQALEFDVRSRLTQPYKFRLLLKSDHAPFKAGDVIGERFDDPGWRLWIEDVETQPPGTQDSIQIPGRELRIERIDNPDYNPRLSVHIIGFAKVVGDVTAATRQVVLLFALTVFGTFVALLIYLRDLRLAWLPMACSIIAVIWELGLLRTFGFGLDPFAIMVPFLVLAISTSHGVQYVNTWADQIVQGDTPFEASRQTYRRLFIPGSIALITNVAGFLTIALVPIVVIREMSANACLGMLAVIATNKLLMPIWLSQLRVADAQTFRERRRRVADAGEWLWQRMAIVTAWPVAAGLLLLAAGVLVASWQLQAHRIIGDAQSGVPELRPESVYNRDSRTIAQNFTIATDILKVIAETDAWTCVQFPVMEQIDQLSWRMENTLGVQSTLSLTRLVRQSYAGFSEGNPKFRVLPRNRDLLVWTTKSVETSSGLLNVDCSAMPVFVFTSDHKATTIHRITDAVEQFNRENEARFYANTPGSDRTVCEQKRQARREGKPSDQTTVAACPVHFALATGNIGVMAATNDVIEQNELKTVLWVYAVIGLLLLLSYRSLTAIVVIGVPLFLVSIFANALMAVSGIGLKVATLPVVTLAVGIGVDYGIYIYDVLRHQLDAGMNLREAYIATLRRTGKAVIFTGICLAGGVFAWLFSELQFQRDMGLLLLVMFLANMFGAVLIGPALCSFLLRKRNIL